MAAMGCDREGAYYRRPHQLLLDWALIPETQQRPNSLIRKVKAKNCKASGVAATRIMMNMNRVVLYARKFLKNTNPNCSSVKFTAFGHPRFRFYASESDSSNLPNTQNNNGSIGVEDVSSQELKSRIEKYLEGDEDAIPSIFEAILSRKLSGKHDQSDDELMEELQIRTKTSDRDANEEDEFDSGSDS